MERYLITEGEIFMRIVAALVAGGLIGFERERKGKAAGFVTNVLVCVGSASIAVIQCLIVKDSLEAAPALRGDPGRLIAQVVSGIGFLGAGAILRDRGNVKGITTAATIWVVAALGIAYGMGYYFLGSVVTLTVYFSIMTLKKLELYFLTNKVRVGFYLEYFNSDSLEEKIEMFFEEKAIVVEEFNHLEEIEEEDSLVQRATVELIIPRYMDVDDLIKDVSLEEEINKFKKLKKQKFNYWRNK